MSELTYLSEVVLVDGIASLGTDFQSSCGYEVKHLIEKGNFSNVYLGRNAKTEERVAIKVQFSSGARSTVAYEAKVYRALAKGLDKDVPKMHWSGIIGKFNVMVMDLLGPSLEVVFNACRRQLRQTEIARIGTSIVNAVEFLHSKGFVHRNIKPSTILFNMKDQNKVHLTGLGLAKKYLEKTNEHIALQTKKQLLGDGVFSSSRSHNGIQQSRRDDMEAVGNVLLYLTNGSLPWEGLETEDVALVKEICADTRYCQSHIAAFLRHAKNLNFEEAPDYGHLKTILKEMGATSKRQRSRSPRSSMSSAFSLPSYNFVMDWTIRMMPSKNTLYSSGEQSGQRHGA